LADKIFVFEESQEVWLDRYVDPYPLSGSLAAVVAGKLFVKSSPWDSSPLEEFDLEKEVTRFRVRNMAVIGAQET
jgi:hypothetical protein